MRMLRRQRVLLIAAFLAVIVVAFCCWVYARKHPPPKFDANKLVEALVAYSNHQHQQQRAMPESVTLQELVAGGYLPAEQMQAFGSSNVTISLTANETRPTEMLIEARLPDGSRCVALSDGSIAQLSTNQPSRVSNVNKPSKSQNDLKKD